MDRKVRVAIVSKSINRKIFNTIKDALFLFTQSIKEALKSKPDIIVVDDTGIPEDIDDNTKVLIVGEVTKEKVLRYLNYPSFYGFIRPNIPSDLMDKAIKTLKKGEIWVNREIISMIFEEFSKHVRKRHYNSDLLNTLSVREKEVLHLISRGYSNKDTAKALFVSDKTVKTHLYNIYKKLGVNRRTEAISLLFQEK